MIMRNNYLEQHEKNKEMLFYIIHGAFPGKYKNYSSYDL